MFKVNGKEPSYFEEECKSRGRFIRYETYKDGVIRKKCINE